MTHYVIQCIAKDRDVVCVAGWEDGGEQRDRVKEEGIETEIE